MIQKNTIESSKYIFKDKRKIYLKINGFTVCLSVMSVALIYTMRLLISLKKSNSKFDNILYFVRNLSDAFEDRNIELKKKSVKTCNFRDCNIEGVEKLFVYYQ